MRTIPLRDALRALRAEVVEAANEASNENVRFDLESIELEFQVVATTEIGADAKVGAKIDFHIFSADATLGTGGKGVDERMQNVKIVLTPALVTPGGTTKVQVRRGATSVGKP
jgi:hypothetical protein